MNKTILMGLLVNFVVACTADAAGLMTLHSFATETKLKGGFTQLGEHLYSSAEKGGDHGFGAIVVFDPANGSLTPVHHFPTDTKVKGGFVRFGGSLYFLTEKGGPTAGYSYVGRYDPDRRTVVVEREFESDVRAKSGFAEAGGLLWLTTEKGGAGSGSIENFDPKTGIVTRVAVLSPELGTKVESLATSADARTVFAGAREGGDLTELSGKGAGSLLSIEVSSGQVRRLTTFQSAKHGTKLRGLTVVGEDLWFIQEEGGDPQVN